MTYEKMMLEKTFHEKQELYKKLFQDDDDEWSLQNFTIV